MWKSEWSDLARLAGVKGDSEGDLWCKYEPKVNDVEGMPLEKGVSGCEEDYEGAYREE